MSPDITSLTLADHGRAFGSTPTNDPSWYYFPSLINGATLGAPRLIQGGTVMLKILISIGLLAGFAIAAYAQGQIQLANTDNTSSNPAASANGLFWLSTGEVPVLINRDFNAAFYGGTDSSSLSPLATFLISNGTAAGDNMGGQGTFVDPTGNAYTFPGPFSAFFQIQAWTGNFNSYAVAVNGGAFAAQSPVFLNPLESPPGPPRTLTAMPAIVLTVPEPSTFVLVGLGGLYVLLIQAGTSVTEKRIGDYSATSLDPTNNNTFESGQTRKPRGNRRS